MQFNIPAGIGVGAGTGSSSAAFLICNAYGVSCSVPVVSDELRAVGSQQYLQE